METPFIGKVRAQGGTLVVTIPASVQELSGIKKGDYASFTLTKVKGGARK